MINHKWIIKQQQSTSTFFKPIVSYKSLFLLPKFFLFPEKVKNYELTLISCWNKFNWLTTTKYQCHQPSSRQDWKLKGFIMLKELYKVWTQSSLTALYSAPAKLANLVIFLGTRHLPASGIFTCFLCLECSFQVSLWLASSPPPNLA